MSRPVGPNPTPVEPVSTMSVAELIALLQDQNNPDAEIVVTVEGRCSDATPYAVVLVGPSGRVSIDCVSSGES